MQYVACKFRETDARTYTYEWEGDPLSPGDVVKVADNRDASTWKRVTVVSVTDEAPPFPCKPIIGKVDDDPAAEPDGDDPLAADTF